MNITRADILHAAVKHARYLKTNLSHATGEVLSALRQIENDRRTAAAKRKPTTKKGPQK